MARPLAPWAEGLEARSLLSTVSASGTYVPGELIVQFKAGVGDAARAASLERSGSTLVERFDDDFAVDPGRSALERITLSPDETVESAIARLAADPNVAFAEPNWIYTTLDVSNDPLYTNGSLWGMYSNDSPSAVGPVGTTNPYGSQAEKAWNLGFTGSKQVYVAVIDEGIQTTHPDLDANVWSNPYDRPDGIDNDGNGYVDDVNGWDFFSNDASVYDGGTGGQEDSHGTHVAGTIGAERNGAGVVGVNWNVTMISAKFLGPGGGSLADAVRAVDYVTDLKVRHGLNIVATNNSWGGGGYSQALYDAIQRAGNAGILFVAAAGNSSNDNDRFLSYPSGYDLPNIISVASLNSAGGLSWFSNYGRTTVDLAAPGENVISTVPFNGYAAYSGTSMATPHVTGAAALFASKTLAETGALPNALQIKEALLASATPTASIRGATLTGGRLDVAAALNYNPNNPPAAPSNVLGVVVGPGRVRLSWSDNSLLEEGFEVQLSSDGGFSYTPLVVAPAESTSYGANDLPSGVSLTFRVRSFKTTAAGRVSSEWAVSPAVVTPTKVASPYTDPFTNNPLAVGSPWAFTTAGEWSYSTDTGNPLLRQPAVSTTGIERKAVLVGLEGVATEIKARVRVDQWKAGEYAVAGVGLKTDLATGQGYSLVVTGRYGSPKLEFLNDRVAWSSWYDPSSSVNFNLRTGTWYWFSMRERDGVLYGKVWADGTAEPANWTLTFSAAHSGWDRETGYASVYGGYSASDWGGSSYASASFDDVTAIAPPPPRVVSSPYTERFDEDPTAAGSPWAFTNAADWTYNASGGALDQSGTGDVSVERKAMLVGLDGTASAIRAKVRLNTWQGGEYALAGVGLFTDPKTGQGLNLVVTGRHNDGRTYLEFLNDRVAWSGWDFPPGNGTSVAYAMAPGDWHWFDLRYINGMLYGKVWPAGTTEPQAPMLSLDTRNTWGWGRSGGFAALNGSYSGTDWYGRSFATASFDDVTVSTSTLPPLGLSGVAAKGASPAPGVDVSTLTPVPAMVADQALSDLARDAARRRKGRGVTVS